MFMFNYRDDIHTEKCDGITRFRIKPGANFRKWLHQNDAEYTGDFVEGCLLDNFVVATRRGFAAVYEKYLNPNASVYYVEFEPGAAQNVFSNWYKFEAAAESEEN